MKTLELFCGTKSFSKNFDYDNLSLDIDKKRNPDINIDILEWDYKQYPPKSFDIIWASPPCIEYSTCMTRRPRKLEYANSIVKRVLEIIDYFKPTYYFIENPYTGLLRKQSFMSNLPYIVVDYCKYGYTYRKRTIIFTNKPDIIVEPLCRQDCNSCISKKHIGHFGRGASNINLDSRYSIPNKLIQSLLA